MKKKNNGLAGVALAMVVFGGWVCSADATVTLSYNDAQPTNTVVSYIPPMEEMSGYAWANNANPYRRDMGQTFLAPRDFTMHSFSYCLSKGLRTEAVKAAFTVTVFESTIQGRIGTVISKQSGIYLDSRVRPKPAIDGWVTFDIEDLDLTKGNFYTLMLSWDQQAESKRDQGFFVKNPGSYAGGNLWVSANGKRYSKNKADMVFVVR